MRAGLILLAIGAVAISSCSPEARQAASCKRTIKEGLLNPETAQFFEFTKADIESFKKSISDAFWRRNGIDPSESWRYEAAEADINQKISRIVIPGASYYRYRVKAASRLGLTVTSTYACMTTDEGCLCNQEDS
ncbi:MAG: hypothetical protein K1X67_26830 [Fimbriimonadaceae bacterium]|nr:hypothetical protein [Fimbriimonadaceae bacterium]